MLPEEFVETLVVLGMFVLRIGAPVAVTLALGYWLEKKLRPQEEQKNGRIVNIEAARRGRSSKIIQLHCWDLHHCESTQRAACAAYQHPDLPCWLALQVAGNKVHEQCFSCALYKNQNIAA
jgi:hypothetical protein